MVEDRRAKQAARSRGGKYTEARRSADTGAVRCRACRNMTHNPSGYCHHHGHLADQGERSPAGIPAAPASTSARDVGEGIPDPDRRQGELNSHVAEEAVALLPTTPKVSEAEEARQVNAAEDAVYDLIRPRVVLRWKGNHGFTVQWNSDHGVRRMELETREGRSTEYVQRPDGGWSELPPRGRETFGEPFDRRALRHAGIRIAESSRETILRAAAPLASAEAEEHRSPEFRSDSSGDVGRARYGDWVLASEAFTGEGLGGPLELERMTSRGPVRYTTPHTLEFDHGGVHYVLHNGWAEDDRAAAEHLPGNLLGSYAERSDRPGERFHLQWDAEAGASRIPDAPEAERVLEELAGGESEWRPGLLHQWGDEAASTWGDGLGPWRLARGAREQELIPCPQCSGRSNPHAPCSHCDGERMVFR